VTASLQPRAEGWTQGRADGCTARGCGTQQTVTVSRVGRRCESHPDQFDPSHAVALMVDGWAGTALAYCRTWA
jgi:hypothetical protein